MKEMKLVATIGDLTVYKNKYHVFVKVDGNTVICMRRKSKNGLAELISALASTLK